MVKREDAFYMKATARGFVNVPVGQHVLETFIPGILKEAGFIGRFTLHSLRATCATRLYNKGFDEQLVQEITGHSSVAVREYKRTSDDMKKDASFAIQRISNMETSVVIESSSTPAKITSDVKKTDASLPLHQIPNIETMQGKSYSTPAKNLRIECGELRLELNF